MNFCLVSRLPKPNAPLLGSFNPPDSGGEFRAPQSRVSSLIDQASHGRDLRASGTEDEFLLQPQCLNIPILKIGILGVESVPVADNPEHRDLFRGALEVMILQSLRLKPMHGYALVKHIKQVSDDLLQVEEGSLYPALQRMLKEGWLEAETGTSAKGRPTRIYRLTDAGIRHLEKEVISVEKMFAGITRVLAVAKV
jgi:PadR family transcriptional regulator PadR